ncbi:MAG: protein jag [Selenomonadaceae bacterium]|nr:protein jag [Selenomonadaceae bacterium]
MADMVEKTGKTVEEALRSALLELGASEDQVSYEVLAHPSKGIFGFGAKPARIRVTRKEQEAVPVAARQPVEAPVEVEQEKTEEGYVFNLVGEKLGILIGKHGQTLDSPQYLANLAANRGLAEDRIRVILDVEKYRRRREETLKRLAMRLADKANRIRAEVKLEPMNRHERKIIHMALQDHRRVSTYSDGEEPYRYVVIVPKRLGRHEKEKKSYE